MNQEQLLTNPNEIKVERPVVSQRTRQPKQKIPTEYIPVKFDTLGKLEAPAMLHFRNYTMENMLYISSVNEDKRTEALIKILNDMVFEDFDCSYLHDKELQTVMMTLYISFWGKVLKDVPYLIDKEKGQTKDNIGYTDVDLSILETVAIADEFKEPIGIEFDGKKVYFQLQKIKTIIDAVNHVEEKFEAEERTFSDFVTSLEQKSELEKVNKDIAKKNIEIEKKNELIEGDVKLPMLPLQEIPVIDESRIKDYEEYVKSKAVELVRINQALLIHDNSAKTVEEKIEMLSKIDMRYWNKYEDVKSKYDIFGPVNKLKVFNTKDQKSTLRRLEFRYTDFIPTMESSSNDAGEVSFG